MEDTRPFAAALSRLKDLDGRLIGVLDIIRNVGITKLDLATRNE